jgi:hypothetical protein
MQEAKLERLEWSEPNPDALHRPQSGSEWVGLAVAFVVLLVLAFAGLMILRSSFAGGWSLVWVVPAALMIFTGGFGAVRSFGSIFAAPGRTRTFTLTNLEVAHELMPGQPEPGLPGELWIRGRIRATVIGRNAPKSLLVTLRLRPEHYPGENEWLNHVNVRFETTRSNGAGEFAIHVPRQRTVLGTTHATLEIRFEHGPIWYRTNLEPIAQTDPIQVVYRPSDRDQLEAFANGDASDLVSRAYNGEHASAGWLMHHGGPSLHDFTTEEQSRVFTVSFAQLIDHLERTGFFSGKIRDPVQPLPGGYSLVRSANEFQVVFRELDLGPVYSDSEWSTVLHATTFERHAFEAFVLHSDPQSRVLAGATALLEVRSDGDGKPHPQAH